MTVKRPSPKTASPCVPTLKLELVKPEFVLLSFDIENFGSLQLSRK